MDVRVNVELEIPAAEKHLREMRSTAESLTNNRDSVRIWVDEDDSRSMLAAFTIPKARQRDVVDKILKSFSMFMEDYATQSIWFPKPVKKERGD